MKNILIAGGTGFLGKALESYFDKNGSIVNILTRNPTAANHHKWDGCSIGNWTKLVEQADVLINLSGKSVDCRYTPINKEDIMQSRIQSTRILDEAVSKAENKPSIFINASSATIYIHSETQAMTERTGIVGDDFSMNVVKAWETCFFKREIEGVRKVALRTSIVLGETGGALPKVKMIAKLGLGGMQGSGSQMVSWIHVDDFCRAVEHIIDTKYIEGPINVTGPNPITNSKFMQTIRENVNPIFYLNQPKFLLELGAIFMRTETELLLKSRFVVPDRLLKSGFEFKYETIEDYLIPNTLHKLNASNYSLVASSKTSFTPRNK